MPRDRQSMPAFTLLELLAASSLMVVVGACLYGSLATAFKTKQLTEETLRPLERLQAAMDLVIQDLQGAAEPNTTLAGHFIGSNDRTGSGLDFDTLSFTTTHHPVGVDENRLQGGVGHVELSLEQDTTNTQTAWTAATRYHLVRRVVDNVLDEDADTAVEEVLCRRVRSLNLRYYDGSQWLDEWDSSELQDTLPVAVEVTLELEPSEKDRQRLLSPDTPQSLRTTVRIPRLTQIVTLPLGVPLIEVEQSAPSGGGAG